MTLNEYFNKDQIELHPCGVEFLKKRKDDNLDVVISRYDTYMSSTKPVLDFYAKNLNFTEKGNLFTAFQTVTRASDKC